MVLGQMRYPATHKFLCWLAPATLVFIGALVGIVIAASQVWEGVKRWTEELFLRAWPTLAADWFLISCGVAIAIYLIAIIWTGQTPKKKAGILLTGEGLDHVRVETGSPGRGPYEARFFPTERHSETPGLIVWIVEKIREVFKELMAETRPVASVGVEFIPATPAAPCSPICFAGLVEAKDTPKNDWTALRVLVRNDSDQNLVGLVARLTRAEPEIGSLNGPINLPLILATKGRLDRLRSPTVQEQIPHQGFNLHAHSEKAIEVVWLHSKGALEGYITHEAGETDFLFVGSQELYVEVTGAGQPIVAGVRINIADDDVQSWTPELIIEAAGEALGQS